MDVFGRGAAGVQATVSHDVIVGAVVLAEDPPGRTVALVDFAQVPDDGRLAGAGPALIAAAPALGRDEGVNLDAVDVALAAIVQSVVVDVGGE